MATETSIRFRDGLAEVRRTLLGVDADLADVPWRPHGWTRKQIVGHLVDSATNNRQRFVRAALEGSYDGPGYAQEAWVELQGYAAQRWETLLGWWQAEHEMLMAIVGRIPEERLGAECIIGGGAPVTLQFLINDYVAHQSHHLAQITSSSAHR